MKATRGRRSLILVALAGLVLLPVLMFGARALLTAPVQLEHLSQPMDSIGLTEMLIISAVCGVVTFLLVAVMAGLALVLARHGSRER